MALILSGCSAHKPILYPNGHYRQVGEETAESDINACMALAKEAGASPGQGKTAETATDTVAGGAVGSAAGAVGGAIFGIPEQGRWWARPVARPPGFFVGCSGELRRAGPTRIMWIAVCVNVATIRQDGTSPERSSSASTLTLPPLPPNDHSYPCPCTLHTMSDRAARRLCE